jgi:hypothetical protein
MKAKLAFALPLLVLVAPRVAGAQSDPAAAEAAFAEARALIKQGKWDEACPKLEASLALDPAVGTILNLGECLAKTGRTASAWLRYREAAAMALQKGQPERERIARERADELSSRLCRIIIRAPRRSDLVVSRDGVVVDANVVGVPVPVDPGVHEVRAEAQGEAPFDARVEVKAPPAGAPCGDTTIDVPFAATPPSRALAPISLPPEDRPAGEAPGWQTIHTLAVAATAGGLVAAGIGTAFGISAASAKNDADAQCTAAGCTPDGRDRLDEAGRRADVATVAFAAAGALVVTGVVLWIVSPSLGAPAKASARPRDAAFVVRF